MSQASEPMLRGCMKMAEESLAPIGSLMGGPPGIPGSPRPATGAPAKRFFVPLRCPMPGVGVDDGVVPGSCPGAFCTTVPGCELGVVPATAPPEPEAAGLDPPEGAAADWAAQGTAAAPQRRPATMAIASTC